MTSCSPTTRIARADGTGNPGAYVKMISFWTPDEIDSLATDREGHTTKKEEQGTRDPMFAKTQLQGSLSLGVALLLVGFLNQCQLFWNTLIWNTGQIVTSGDQENRDRGGFTICRQNPYLASLSDDAETITGRMDLWLNDTQLQTAHQEALTNEELLTKWNRFAFAFPTLSGCREEEKACLGGPCGRDESKITCGARHLNHSCVVYSIGGNNQWQFEEDVLAHTNCEVHTFDCTGSIDRFDRKPDGVHFHHVCLGTDNLEAPANCTGTEKCGETWTLEKIQSQLQHDRIDLLKADIEGYEWSLLESWWDQHQLEQNGTSRNVVVLPHQIMMEVHYKTQFAELRPPGTSHRRAFKSPDDMVYFHEKLLRIGYIVIERDDNRRCPHCTELTLVRARCPSSSALL
jgi:Methyltransferase domain